MPVCEVVLVEDDDVIRENLYDFLESQDFSVRAYEDRPSALAGFQEKLPDIAVLDVGLGAERDGGFTLCRQIREISLTLPIVFLTSYDAEADKISGLKMGADDYLSKESSLDYLVVRLETLLSRYRAVSEPFSGSSTRPMVGAGPLSIDEERSLVMWREKEVLLPLTQYWMVIALASDPSSAKSADELMKAAKIHVTSNTIASHVRSIRQRFQKVDPEFDAIRTERGLGYRWVG